MQAQIATVNTVTRALSVISHAPTSVHWIKTGANMYTLHTTFNSEYIVIVWWLSYITNHQFLEAISTLHYTAQHNNHSCRDLMIGRALKLYYS